MAKKRAGKVEAVVNLGVSPTLDNPIQTRNILGLSITLNRLSFTGGYRVCSELGWPTLNCSFYTDKAESEFLNESEFFDFLVCESILCYMKELGHFENHVGRMAEIQIYHDLVKKVDLYDVWLFSPDDKPPAQYVLQIDNVKLLVHAVINGLTKYGAALLELRPFLKLDLFDVRDSLKSFELLFYELGDKFRHYIEMFNLAIELAYRRNNDGKFLTQRVNGLSSLQCYKAFSYHSINLSDTVTLEERGEILTRDFSINYMISILDIFEGWISSLIDFQNDLTPLNIALPNVDSTDISNNPTNNPPMFRNVAALENPLNETQVTIIKGMDGFYDGKTITVKLLHERLVNQFEFKNDVQTVRNEVTNLKRLGYIVSPYGERDKNIQLTDKGRELFPRSS